MFNPAHWLNLVWFPLLPLAALGVVLLRYRRFWQGWRRGLVRPAAWRWLRLALGACLVFLWSVFATFVYETAIWPGLAAAAASLMMVVGLGVASRTLHPGLLGFQRPVPHDGLQLIEWELTRPGWLAWRWRLWRWWPIVPVALPLLFVARHVPERWPGLAITGLAVAAPLLLVPHRRAWLGPLLLLPLSLVIGWRAASLRASLPPGHWTTPVTGAKCTARVVVSSRAARPLAWCADLASEHVYQFNPDSGLVISEIVVEEGWYVFAADDAEAWVTQSPLRGLVQVRGNRTAALFNVHFAFAAQVGALEPDGTLWGVDVLNQLWARSPEGAWRTLGVPDGLVNNTANIVRVAPDGTVWAGSVGGASRLWPDTTGWETYGAAEGLPGPVINIAFGPDGTVWFLWRKEPGLLPGQQWGVSGLSPDGRWQHANLAALTGLEAPRTPDSLAVDGLSRVWFLTLSTPRREKYLGIFDPVAGGLAGRPYSLGQFASRGPLPNLARLQPGPYGLSPDGRGGIYLYNGDRVPLRHWRP